MNPKKTDYELNTLGVRYEDEMDLAAVQAVFRRPLMDADDNEETTVGTLPRLLQVLGIHLHDAEALRLDPNTDGVTDGRLVFLDVDKFRKQTKVHKIDGLSKVLSLSRALAPRDHNQAVTTFMDAIAQGAAFGGENIARVSPAELSALLVGLGGTRLRDKLGAPDAADATACENYAQDGQRNLQEALSLTGRKAAIEALMPEARSALAAPLDTSDVELADTFNVTRKWNHACLATALGRAGAEAYAAGTVDLETAVQSLACMKTVDKIATIVEDSCPINPALETFLATAVVQPSRFTEGAHEIPLGLKEEIAKVVANLPTCTKVDRTAITNSLACFESAMSQNFDRLGPHPRKSLKR